MLPLNTPAHVNHDVMTVGAAAAAQGGVPMWCPWPMPAGWMVTGVAWVGDENHSRVSATVVVCSGPTPLGAGPADLLLIAEELGVGLGARMAGLSGPDLGPGLAGQAAADQPHAKVKAGGHPTPLWSVGVPDDHSVYAGEAKGRWLYVVAWPAHAGYFLAETPTLHDLTEWVPPELVYGAPSSRLLIGR